MGYHPNFRWSKFVKMKEQNLFNFVQNFREFRCIFAEIFDLIFAKKFHFRVIFVQFSFGKNQNFLFHNKKIFCLRKKKDFAGEVENFNEFRENLKRISLKFRTNFAKVWNENIRWLNVIFAKDWKP